MLSYLFPEGNQEVALHFPICMPWDNPEDCTTTMKLGIYHILSTLLSPGHVFTIAFVFTSLEIVLWNDSGHPDKKICIWLFPTCTSTPLSTFIQGWVSTAPVTMLITALFGCWLMSSGQEQFYPKMHLSLWSVTIIPFLLCDEIKLDEIELFFDHLSFYPLPWLYHYRYVGGITKAVNS